MGAGGNCGVLLLQDSLKLHDGREVMPPHGPDEWRLLWEGKRAADRDERFRLYQRVRR